MDPKILAKNVSNFIISDLIFYHSQQPLTSPTDRLTEPPKMTARKRNKRVSANRTPLFVFKSKVACLLTVLLHNHSS